MKTTQWAAFLRGVNVGGQNPIKMDALREALASSGLGNVKTVLASGNVVFEVPSGTRKTIARKIESQLKESFGREIGVIVRSIEELWSLTEHDPFKRVKAGSQSKQYVTFLPDTPTKKPKLDKKSTPKGVTIVDQSQGEVLIQLDLGVMKSPDLMTWLDKELGRQVTTRTWKTVERVLKAVGE